MEQKRHEKIFLIVLVILAIAGIFFFSYRFWEDSRFLHEGNVSKLFEPMVSKGEAIELSKEFLNLNKFSIDGYDSALSFYSDDNAYSFLERNIGKREAIEYYKNNNLSFGSYDVRFFKELEIEEFFVGIDLESGRVVSFAHIIPEKEERQNLEKEEAREVVMSFLNSLNYDLQDFEEKDYSTQKIQNRTDHVFRFKLKGSELDSKYGEAYVVIYADVLGDKIGGFNYYLFVPEEFEREINKQLSSGIFLTILSYLATIFMFILAFIFLIKAFVNKKANWKSYLLLSLITLAILIVSTINEYPALKSFYTTDSPFLVYIGIAIAIGIIISILFVSTIFISGVSGDFLAKEVWKEKIKNT
ncbi:hypothetical protein FJZ17_04420, partial [Candidatus Pacearchaeota archaeon]|nr:hypothetical protein [Candidatus Pacearchaeota archaeon]